MKQALIALFIVIALTSTAWAEEQPTPATPTSWGNLYINVYELGTIVFPKGGGDAIPLPLATTLGLNIINPINPWLGWSTEIGVGSPNTSFNPAPYALSGPIFFATEKLSLNPFGFYQLNPPYMANGKETTHLLGGGIAVGVVITKEITFLFPVSATITLGGPSKDWALTMGPGLSFLLL